MKFTILSKNIYLAIGSNQKNRLKNIYNCFIQLEKFCNLLEISSIFKTKPIGFNSKKFYYNLVLKVSSKINNPFLFLKNIKYIEQSLGRSIFHNFWGDRTIDIDILFFKNLLISHEILTIPHKLIFNRDFVFIPLIEILFKRSINYHNFSYIEQLYNLANKKFNIYFHEKNIVKIVKIASFSPC